MSDPKRPRRRSSPRRLPTCCVSSRVRERLARAILTRARSTGLVRKSESAQAQGLDGDLEAGVAGDEDDALGQAAVRLLDELEARCRRGAACRRSRASGSARASSSRASLRLVAVVTRKPSRLTASARPRTKGRSSSTSKAWGMERASGRGQGERKGSRHPGASARGTLHPDLAAVQLDEGPRHVEADAAASFLRAEVRLVDPVESVLGMPGPVSAISTTAGPSTASCHHGQAAAPRHGLEGVHRHVQEGLAQTVRIAANRKCTRPRGEPPPRCPCRRPCGASRVRRSAREAPRSNSTAWASGTVWVRIAVQGAVQAVELVARARPRNASGGVRILPGASRP